jgi:hypothetical protein
LGHPAVIGTIAGVLILACAPDRLLAQPPESAARLVRETVYNELQDHNNHGYWRYWIEQRVQNDTRLEEQVETADGPISKILKTNGQPVDHQTREEERVKLQHLMDSPQEQASRRKDYIDDENQVAEIMQMLPDAYVFEYAGEENGCHHVRFSPRPSYVPHSIQARVVHAMAGDLWIDARMKRLSRIEGHLAENVDFGFGLIGRVQKGGWFQIQRIQVSPSEWKTQRMQVHLNGRAILFKTIARETDEVRGGFASVPAGINLAQGMRILEQTDPLSLPNTVARVSPVSFTAAH